MSIDLTSTFGISEPVAAPIPAPAPRTTVREAPPQLPCHNEHFLPKHWRDAPPRNGRIRTTCKHCGKFIGYRPDDDSKRRDPIDDHSREDQETEDNETQTAIEFEAVY